MKTFASIIVVLSFLLGQLTPVLAQGPDPETPTPTETATEEPATATDVPTPLETPAPTETVTDELTAATDVPAALATTTPVPSTGTTTTETPLIQTTPTAPLTEPSISAVTLSLTSTPGFISAGGNITIQWEITGLDEARISGLTLEILLPEGVEPDGNSKNESFDEASRIFSFAVEKLQGQFQLQTDKGSEGILLSAELVKGEETQAVAELFIPRHETFEVKQGGGTFRALNDTLKVTFPAEALPEDTVIDIGFPTKDSIPEYSLSGRPFEIKAHGKSDGNKIHQFEREIEFEAQYGDLNISELDEQYLQLYWYDPETKEWTILPSWVDKENKVLHGLTTHFTVFDIGVNNWTASRLPTIDSFQVSTYTGAATYSLPLEVPPGPGGFQPDLTLSYNSQVIDQATIQAQASWVGMGWSLDGGSIFPNLDGSGYILNIGGVGNIMHRTADGSWHLNDENFWRIFYTANGWGINDKRGNTYYFEEKATGYSYNGGRVESTTLGWYLSRICNNHGQEINYSYVKQTKSIGGYPSVTAEFLDTITYSNGRYRIRFGREARTDYTAVWDVDAGLHLFEKERLKNIHIEQDADGNGSFETTIRRYQLNYASATDADRIWPNIIYTAGGMVSTLRSVTQYDKNDSNLPPVTFTYDNLHLLNATNGYGGRVDFVYETTPYIASNPRPSYSFYTPFCNGLGKNGWTGGIYCMSEDGEKWTQVGGTATTTKYDPNLTKPGGAYFIGTDLSSGTLSVGLNNGLTNQMVASNYATIVLSPAANNADPIMSSPSYGVIGPFLYQLRASFYRVTQKTISDGNGHTYNFNYSYTGATVSPLGNWCAPPPNAWSCVMEAEAYSEFRGHSTVTETGPDGRKTITNFYQDDIYKGRPSSVTVQTAAGTTLTKTVYSYNNVPLPIFFPTGWTFNGYGHYWIYQTSQENRVYNSNGTTYSATLASYTYDSANGNLLTQTDASWNGSSWTNYRVTSTDYFPNTGTPYLVSLPARQQVKDAGGTLLSETLYLYDGASTYNTMPAVGKLTAARTLINAGQYAQASYGYDAWGNQTSVTTYTGYGSASSAPTVGAQTTSTVYDPDYHTYPVSITNALNQPPTTLTYDYTKGVPISETDANGVTTSAAYDAFGRITSLTRPLDAGASLTISYQDSFPFTTSITQKIDASTNYTLTRRYDGMGREFQTNAGGILTDTLHDAYGRVTSQSTPYAGSETKYYALTSYDALGRPVTLAAPDGSQTGYAYNGLVTTLTDAKGQATTTTNDIWGRTVSVSPPTGPGVTYGYDQLGRLLTATRGGATTTMAYNYAGQKLTMSDPDMGNWSYTYDALGNLKTQTDARSCVLTINYDLINRPTNKSSSGSGCGTQVSTSFGYDSGTNGIGHRTSMSDASGSTAWSYDARGRMTSEVKNLGQAYTTGWTYNFADLPVTMTYPDNEVVTYSYNNRMLLNSVIGSSTYLTSTTYDSAGRIDLRALGNGLSQDFTYYAWNTTAQGGRLQNVITGALQDLNYTYDAVGNITQIRDDIASETSNYGYDNLDRLTSWTLGSQTESYSYNAATGNLDSKAGINYTYNTTLKHAVASLSNGNSYGYDANGNQTTRAIGGNTVTLGYDAENRLVSVTGTGLTASFVYDGDGARVKSTINGVTTYFVGSHYEKSGSTVTKYYFAGTSRIAMRKGGTLSYLLSDHLGSTSLTTNASGALISELRYKPWGETRFTSGTTPTRYTYTGQYSNVSDFGLMFYNARWYDPALGRFAQADSILPGGVQGYDRYAYTNNNPVRYTDSSGHCIDGISTWVCIAAVVTVGAFLLAGETPRPADEISNAPVIDLNAKAGPFGDIFPDAILTSHTLTGSWGLNKNNYVVDGIDIVQTFDEVGVFTSRSVSHGAENCQSTPCYLNPPKDTWVVPTIGYSKTYAFIWGGDLSYDLRNYQGRASVLTGNIGPFGLEGFSSTDPNTGKPDYKVVGIGATGGLSLPFDAGGASYYSDAEYVDWASFKKPWRR